MLELTINSESRGKSVISCGEGAFADFAERYSDKKITSPESVREGKIFIITDGNVKKIYGKLIEETFGEFAPVYVLAAGERSKNIKKLQDILRFMLASGIKRSGTVIAFGGGVVGDIAGLAACLYMRGTRLVQIPTTLLSQVDSSVGGKTAVDFDGTKNVIGAFYQAEEVIVDPMFLRTLPPREIRCGLGEIVKYGALDGKILEKLIKNLKKLKYIEFLEEITYDCIAHKARVVADDERDLTGIRKSLNLGHTTGHAFELRYGRKSHGEYVLIGMFYELYIAEKLGVCSREYADCLKKLIFAVIGKVPAFDGVETAAAQALRDKKNTDDKISLVVPQSKGKWAEIKLGVGEYSAYLSECSRSLKEERL